MQQVMAVLKRRIPSNDAFVEVRCPHCDALSTVNLADLAQYAPRVLHCEVEEGGCDLPFMVRGEVLPAPVRLQIGLALSDFYTLPNRAAGPITNPQQIEAAMADTTGGDGS